MTTNEMVYMNLDDRPLLDAAKRLATEERCATAALLGALLEIDSRRLYLGEGCASMFAYCTQVLRLAEGAAYNRIEAARAAREYPLILDLFTQSAITLTAVRLLAPHLTAGNHADVLDSARHKSKREIEELVAALRPRPDAPAVVRKLPAPNTTTAALAESSAPHPSSSPVAAVAPSPSEAPPRGEPALVAPLSPERYRIQLTVSRDTHDKFRRAQALLRHAVPSGDAAEIFDRAISLLIESLERRRFAETSQPRVARAPNERSRHIPAAVRRAVWRRDGGRCGFVGSSGRCRESGFIEFHHVEPYAAGGAATAENIQLRCRAHNVYEAKLFFGDSVVREACNPWGDVLSRLVPGCVLLGTTD
ncbi:MAG: HNH endonuclease [Acidobacteria bacterium]|nr:HNH endonuclease [Acidobacteriota bacterium]